MLAIPAIIAGMAFISCSDDDSPIDGIDKLLTTMTVDEYRDFMEWV